MLTKFTVGLICYPKNPVPVSVTFYVRDSADVDFPEPYGTSVDHFRLIFSWDLEKGEEIVNSCVSIV